ncbi:MAG: hypothetical protein GY805_11615 [Chloroflexi bacterium]|nr:hypothetical protein [Chloroflexota bacterium]
MLQGRGVPKPLAILIILFGTGMLLAGFMQGLAYSEGLAVATEFSGSITEDTTWTAVNSPYVLTGDVVVSEGVTLTIQPGVIVSAQMGVELAVEGRLEAIGLPSNPITFTADATDWTGMRFGTIEGEPVWRGNGRLEQVTISNAVDGIIIFSTEPTEQIELINSTIQNSSNHPIAIILDALPRLTMSNLSFENNASNHVWIHPWSQQFTDDVTLTAQPGLENYQFADCSVTPCYVIVPVTQTLTVEPGVTVLFEPSFAVEGRLEAIGLPTNPITITGGIEFGISNDWQGMGNGRLEYVTLDYADSGYGIKSVSISDTMPLEIYSSTIRGNGYPIASTSGSLHNLNLHNVNMAENDDKYIYALLLPTPEFAGNITLSPQPGLLGYEFDASGAYDLVIPSGFSMTVEAGTNLIFREGMGLVTEGYLDVQGTSSAPVTFTKAGENEWGGLLFRGGDVDEINGRLQHAIIQNATSGIRVKVGDNLVQGSVTLEQGIIDANEVGIEVNGGVVTATCTAVTANGRGILINNSGTPTVSIHQSNISGNSVAGFENNHVSQLDARSNWWGDASGPSGLGSGSGDAALGDVLYDPWLDEYDCSAVYQTFLPFVIRP